MHIRARTYLFSIALACVGLTILGCSSKEDIENKWQEVKKSDRASNYMSFLSKYPSSPHQQEAQKALTEAVFIPYMGFIGNKSDMPELAKLKLSDELMRQSPDSVKPVAFTMSGSIGSGMYVNGRIVELAGGSYSGSTIKTVRFGTINCTFAQGGMGKSSFIMLYYLSATRSQRDAIVDYVTEKAP